MRKKRNSEKLVAVAKLPANVLMQIVSVLLIDLWRWKYPDAFIQPCFMHQTRLRFDQSRSVCIQTIA